MTSNLQTEQNMNNSSVVSAGASPAVFNNPEFGSVRVIMKEDGEPLFCLKDVCDCLDIDQPSKVANRIDKDELTGLQIPSDGQSRAFIFVTESGLYDVILGSRSNEKTKPFKKWVTSEVLPSIRKTGSYSVQKTPSFNLPQNYAEALRELAATVEQNEKLLSVNKAQSAKIAEDAPKVAAYDVFMGVSDDLITVGDFAKILHTKWNDIKPHSLFAILREAKILKDSYFDKNLPYQKYIDRGYFKVKETTSTNSMGYSFISRQALITPKGQKYLLDKFMAARESDPELQMTLFEGEE